jgi:hypothetical protein
MWKDTGTKVVVGIEASGELVLARIETDGLAYRLAKN